jgi:hypothetical protein
MHPRSTSASTAFPWYDGHWLRTYSAATEWLSSHRPDVLHAFTDAMRVLRTRPDFRLQHVAHLFDDDVLSQIVEHIKALTLADFDLAETKAFGRFVVRNDPWFTTLQESFVEQVSTLAGEAVEPRYNFLSLYTHRGTCAVHMDAPDAKWTLDVCIEQSEPWPIHFSQIVPWPETLDLPATDWQRAIKESPDLHFESVTLEPNQAVLFAGSSQWHYREPIPRITANTFCNLLFFHFIPRGAAGLIDCHQWPEVFGVPELGAVVKGVT